MSLFFSAAYCRLPEAIDVETESNWIQLDNKVLVLNGKGTHQLLFFKIYEVSLFLESRSTEPVKILASSEPKILLLKFLRDVSSNQLREALYDGFHENCLQNCERFKTQLDSIASVVPDFNEGESLQFTFHASRLQLRSSRGEFQVVHDSEFPSKFLGIWLGPSPPSQSLKNSLLGL